MASTSNVSRLATRPKRTAEERTYIAAVLTGIYASEGRAILHTKNHEYEVALQNARRVALDQARVVIKGKA